MGLTGTLVTQDNLKGGVVTGPETRDVGKPHRKVAADTLDVVGAKTK